MNEVSHQHVGEALRKRRKELGLSQNLLSQKTGVTQARLSGLERGANSRIGTAVLVARTLGLELVPVPRELLPVVEALLEGVREEGSSEEEKPLYALDDEE